MPDRKNILFIMADQLRSDYLACNGHPTIKTPNIDALAATGINFTNTFCQSAVCGPSRMSFYTGRYMFTVDYTNSDIADDPAQHKQSHVLYITEDCKWKGNFVALPNNRVRATSPALWVTGDGAPDFKPSQWVHSAEGHESYLDPAITFNNLYEE